MNTAFDNNTRIIDFNIYQEYTNSFIYEVDEWCAIA